MAYTDTIAAANAQISRFSTWDGIDAESVARMQLQNRFKTGLDIARYTAKIMRADMAAYDADPANYTQSLGCWHGFIGQQKLISIKKHFGTTKGRYLYLSGWMIAALRSEFGPLPDQSMHEKTSVPALIEELYTFLRQADARELGMIFRELDEARKAGDAVRAKQIQARIDSYETHVVPIIADIDAGFGNAEATYLLAKKMIEAGACAIQIENQVSDEKQCGHQDGKVTVPHEDFLAKIRAVRYAFMELGIDDGIIVARTDSLGAGLTKQIAFTREAGDIGDQYNSFLDCEEVTEIGHGDVLISRDGKLLKPKRLPSNLFQFRAGSGEDRCVLDCITSLQNGADLLWIETEKPHIGQIGGMALGAMAPGGFLGSMMGGGLGGAIGGVASGEVGVDAAVDSVLTCLENCSVVAREDLHECVSLGFEVCEQVSCARRLRRVCVGRQHIPQDFTVSVA